MRLLGIEIEGRTRYPWQRRDAKGPPGLRGYLAMGDLTIILGANDTGKTRLLRQIDEDLSWRERWGLDYSSDFVAPDTTFFFEVSERDGQWLAEQEALVDAHSRGEKAEGLDELEAIPRFAVRHEGERYDRDVRVEPVHTLWRCEEGSEVGERLSGSEQGDDGHSSARRAVIGEEFYEAEAPILPVPVRLPTTEQALLHPLVQAVGLWRRAAHYFTEAFARKPPRPPDDEDDHWFSAANEAAAWALDDLTRLGDEIAPSGEWLSDPPLTISASVQRAVQFIEHEANSSLPPFIEGRYRVSVRLAPLTAWDADGPVALGLEVVDSGSVLSLSEVADGLQLWIQLAIAEAVDRLRQATGGLIERWIALSDELDRANGASVGSREWGDRSDEEVEAVLGRARAIAAAADPATVTPVSLSLRSVDRVWGAGAFSLWREDETRSPFAGDPRLMLREARPSIYLIDEPERHLNPRVQRDAARHLERLVARGRSQAIVVSHSAAFLSAAPQARLAHLDRLEDHSAIHALSVSEVEATSVVAETLGFDRGELLTTKRLLLAVEGPADRAVLEGRYGPELFAAGVVIAPLGGLQGQRQLLEMDVLLRFCAQRVAVMFDNTNEPGVRRVMTDPQYRRTCFANRRQRRELGITDEMAALAQIVDRVTEQERVIHGIPLDVPDILDALDEETVTLRLAASATTPRPYPGHREARRLFQQRPDVKKAGFKAFLRDEFGLDTTAESLGAIARDMRFVQRTTPALSGALAEILRLANLEA